MCAYVCVSQLVSVEVENITLRSLEGAHTLVETDAAASDYTPVFHDQVCNQVVLQVSNHKTSTLLSTVHQVIEQENTTHVYRKKCMCKIIFLCLD